MKKLIFVLGLMQLCFSAFGQGEGNVWYFYDKWGLNFNTNPPTLLTNGSLSAGGAEGEGCASISDASGNLLFYTNGVTVYNRNHVAMTNGTGLQGNVSSTQSAIVVPKPGSTTSYYIFTSPVTGSNNSYRYSEVDMTLNGGLGDVLAASKNTVMPLCPNYVMEGQMVIPHNNGTDYWVVGHKAGNAGSSNSSSDYYAWQVSGSGIANPVITSIGYALPSVFSSGAWVSQGQGFIKTNSCYTKIFTSFFAQGTSGRVEMTDFDNATGILSGTPIVINNFDDRNEVYGIEISPNDDFLYVTELGQGAVAGTQGEERLHQFDLTSGVAATINASRYTYLTSLNVINATYFRLGQLQLAPDGKIYVVYHDWNNIGSGINEAVLGVINSPNASGAAANFVGRHIVVTAASNGGTGNGVGAHHGLPQFPRGFIANIANIALDVTNVCAGDPLTYSYFFNGDAISGTWKFHDNTTLNALTNPTPTKTWNTPGTYTDSLILEDACGRTYKAWDTYTVFEKKVATGYVSSCNGGNNITLNVNSPNPAYTYGWFSDAAATNAVGVGTTLTFNGGFTGSYYLRAIASGSTSTSNLNLTNGPATSPTSATAATSTIRFTVNKSDMTFGSFQWATPSPPYAGADVLANYTVTIRDVANTTTYYSRTQSVITAGPTWSAPIAYTENVNMALSPGSYVITITGGSIMSKAGWDSPVNNNTEAEGVLTYNPLSGENIATTFTYSYIKSTTTFTNTLCAPIFGPISYNCALPVSMSNFNANKISSSDNKIYWTTTNEKHIKGFYILSSVDGIHYNRIGFIESQQRESSIPSEYSFIHSSGGYDNALYKLEVMELNGSSNFYGPVFLPKSENGFQISVHPNPSNDKFHITTISDSPVEYKIYNNLGQNIQEGTINENESIIDLKNSNIGHFILQVRNKEEIQTIQLIKY